MSTESINPFALIDVLLRHDVSFAVIGGYAVIFHGYARATEDVDVLFHRTGENEAKLLAALTEADAYWIGDEVEPASGIEKTFPVTAEYIARSPLMMLGTKFGYLDIFDFVPGCGNVDVAQVIATAEPAEGRPFVSLEWLKRMKLASDRPKDREDLRYLP